MTRRELLQDVVSDLGEERLLFSDAVVGNGQAFFQQMHQREFEGIVAKRLDSRYLPGQRTDAWTKIKQAYHMHCLILGYLSAPDDPDDLRSLIIATDEDGQLRCIGRVGSGLTDAMRRELIGLLKPRIRTTPPSATSISASGSGHTWSGSTTRRLTGASPSVWRTSCWTDSPPPRR